jgi:hypothetical protein
MVAIGIVIESARTIASKEIARLLENVFFTFFFSPEFMPQQRVKLLIRIAHWQC